MTEQEPFIPCDEPGCDTGWPGSPCWLPDDGEQPSYYYCAKHAAPLFCLGCGQFNGGIESFEFNPRGLCEHCDVDLQEPRYDDDDDDGYDPRDFPTVTDGMLGRI